MPPQRRVGFIIIGVAAAFALVIGAVVSGFWLWRQHQRFAENGRPCATGCTYAKCVHETDGDSYCANECKSDGDCPSTFVCDPTLSGRHHVCLKGGVETFGGPHRRSRGR